MKSEQIQSRLEVLSPGVLTVPAVKQARRRRFCIFYYDFTESQLFMQDPFEHILNTRCWNTGNIDSASRIRLPYRP
jgi:hypothetical protein